MCKSDDSISVGTNEIPIVFPSSLDSETNRIFISSDLVRVFSFAKNLDAAFATSAASARIELKRYQAPPPFPNELRGQLEVSHSNGHFELVASAELVSRYLAAKEFAQTNAVLLSQFDNIVTIFNNGSVTNMSVAAKKEIFWMPKSGEISDAEMLEIIHMISSRLKLHYPSILNFKENVELEYHVGGDIAEVFAFIVGTDRSNGDFIQTCCIVKIGDKVKLFAF